MIKITPLTKIKKISAVAVVLTAAALVEVSGWPLALIFHQPTVITGAKLMVSQKIYRTDQIPHFTLQYQAKSGRASFGIAYAEQIPQYQLLYNGSSVNIPVKGSYSSGGLDLSLAPSGPVKPGEYTLKVTVDSGKRTQTVQQNFAWGVLALNFDKAVYSPGEIAQIQMAVLSSTGQTICNAPLSVTVTAPDGALSTPPVGASGKCNGDNYTNVPDYHASYQTAALGTYKVTLKLASSDYTMTDYFRVSNSIPFDVTRSGPSRVYPPDSYPIRMTVMPKDNFAGQVTENLPAGFSVQPGQNGKLSSDDSKITWQVDWQAGRQYTLSYDFKTPDVSPAFYFMGPLSFSAAGHQIYQEPRQWQLAGDANVDIADFENGTVGSTITTAVGEADYTAWDTVTIGTGSGIVYDNTHFYDSKSAKFTTGASPGDAYLAWGPNGNFGTQVTSTYGRLYVYFSAVPSAKVIFMRTLTNAGGTTAALALNTSGKLELLDKTDTVQATSTNSVATGQWVRIEYNIVNNSTTGAITAKLFNSPDSTTPTETVSATNINTDIGTGQLRFGMANGASNPASYTLWMDDIDTNEATYPGPAANCNPPTHISLVQTAQNSGAMSGTTCGGTPVTATFSSPTKKGDLVVAAVGASVTSSKMLNCNSGSWQTVASVDSGASTISGQKMYYEISPGGETNFTFANTTTVTKVRIMIFEYSGIDTNHPLEVSDVSQSNNVGVTQCFTGGGTSGNTCTAGSGITPTNAGSLILAAVMTTGTPTGFNAWTNSFNQEQITDSRFAAADFITYNASGSYITTGSWTGTTASADSIIAVFKAGAALVGTNDLMSGGDYFCNQSEQYYFWAS